VSVLLGNGDGTFRAALTFDAGIATPLSISIADFNSDNKPDLAVFQLSPNVFGSLSPAVLAILLGIGDGTFQAAKGAFTLFKPNVGYAHAVTYSFHAR
jgi:hypothetical protein